MIQNRILFTTAQALRHELQKSSSNELAEFEVRLDSQIADAITLAEKRAPGYLAARLIAQIDERPLLACGIPAYMIGGQDVFMDRKASLPSAIDHMEAAVWPVIRSETAKHLKLYFSRVAAGERPAIPRSPGHAARAAQIVQEIWFLFRLRSQNALARIV